MAVCVSCKQPLVLEVDPSDDEEDVEMGESGGAGSSTAATTNKTVPDDVHLTCGCHFHWECLLDAYTVTECPNCNRSIVSSSNTEAQQVLCTLHNEGGLQENLDILPLLTEESYLKAYPEERKARAFLEFCREGDFKAIVDMLKPDFDDKEEHDSTQHIDILRYQDPIGDMQSGLHAAVTGGSREVAWLLILLASRFNLMDFPALVFQEAGALGIMRPEEDDGKIDIRTLRDSNGRTAEDLAREMDERQPSVWHGWVGTGRLAA